MRSFPVYLMMVNPDKVNKWTNYIWCENEFPGMNTDHAAVKSLFQEIKTNELVPSNVSIVCFDNDESVRLVMRFRFGDKGAISMPSFTCDNLEPKLMFAAIRELAKLPNKAEVEE